MHDISQLDPKVLIVAIIVLGTATCVALSQAGAILRTLIESMAQVANACALRKGKNTTAKFITESRSRREVKENFSDSWSSAFTELAKFFTQPLSKH